MAKTNSPSLQTALIHAGKSDIEGAVCMPIFQSANYLQAESGSYDDVRYLRMANSPQHNALHTKIAVLEEAESAFTFASGMSAISTTLMALLSAGDHIVMQSPCYGGTMSLIDHLRRFGIEIDTFDAIECVDLESKIKANTKIVYVESMSNPLLGVADLQRVVDTAKAKKLLSVIDNTFLSPVGFQAIDFGFDLVLHSATKYLNGHSDILAGTVAGRRSVVDVVRKFSTHLGGTLDPHAAYLLERGMKTLAIRMKAQSASTLALVRFLENDARVKSVNYPGLETHPGFARAQKWFSHLGGVFSFEPVRDDVHLRVKIPQHAASLGAVESLIVKPSESTHLAIEPDVRRAAGISDSLLRVSVGLEDPDELIADFDQALG